MKNAPSPSPTKLSLLNNVRVAAPCNARWSDMSGDDHVRYCSGCGQRVFDLSTLSDADSEALLQRSDGNLCVRLYRRFDGTILMADCPVGRRRLEKAARGAVCWPWLAGLFAVSFGVVAFAVMTH